MDKYFSLLKEKKLKIKKLENENEKLQEQTNKLHNEISNLSQEQIDGLQKLENIMQKDKEQKKIEKTQTISFIIFLVTIILGILGRKLGINLLYIMLASTLISTVNASINAIIINKIKQKYNVIRESKKEEIEELNYLIKQIRNQIFTISKKISSLNYQIKELKLLIENETKRIQELYDKIALEYGEFLDDMIANELANNLFMEQIIKLERLRKEH